MTETQAPNGYVAIDPVTLVVYADGTVKLDGDSLGASSKVTIENGEDGTAYISVTDDAAPILDNQDGSGRLDIPASDSGCYRCSGRRLRCNGQPPPWGTRTAHRA